MMPVARAASVIAGVLFADETPDHEPRNIEREFVGRTVEWGNLTGKSPFQCPQEGRPQMSESASRATLEALVAALNASDLEGLNRVFTEDVVMEWPQSGERIVGGQNRREIYSRFPSLPHVTPRRMTGSGDVWVLEASLDYGDGEPFQCVFVFEMRDGLIAKETGYWSKPFPAPDWRAPWVERL